MDDAFDTFLQGSLAPVSRPPDRAFVARVQSRIQLEERWRVQRRASLHQLAWELVALAAVAAAVITISQAPAVRDFLTASPMSALAISAFLIGQFLMPLMRRTGFESQVVFSSRRRGPCRATETYRGAARGS